jgi:hypothetical protein
MEEDRHTGISAAFPVVTIRMSIGRLLSLGERERERGRRGDRRERTERKAAFGKWSKGWVVWQRRYRKSRGEIGRNGKLKVGVLAGTFKRVDMVGRKGGERGYGPKNRDLAGAKGGGGGGRGSGKEDGRGLRTSTPLIPEAAPLSMKGSSASAGVVEEGRRGGREMREGRGGPLQSPNPPKSPRNSPAFSSASIHKGGTTVNRPLWTNQIAILPPAPNPNPHPTDPLPKYRVSPDHNTKLE